MRMNAPRTRSVSRIRVRAADTDDVDFILSLVPRFVAFTLPKGRRRRQCAAAIHADLARALAAPAKDETFFVSENREGTRTGFLHLQVLPDFFSGTRNCHISDLAVAPGHDGHGLGTALLAHAEKWARAHRCRRLTLAVFPGNERALALYERHGFEVELQRMTRPLA